MESKIWKSWGRKGETGRRNAREKERTRKLDNEYQQLTKYIDRLQNENLGIHRGAGIPNLKTKQAQTENYKN